jgi:4-carboxymuconolactone decarboxylase
MSDPVRDEGMRVRREVLGDAHVDRATAATTDFSAPFQDYITRCAWGSVWTRPGLDRRTRSCVTLAALVSLRAEGEIGMHVRAALRHGLTPAEIAEVLLHTGVYAGVPAANAAFAIAQGILRQEGLLELQRDGGTAGDVPDGNGDPWDEDVPDAVHEAPAATRRPPANRGGDPDEPEVQE